MKKLVSLILVCLLTISSVLLASCDALSTFDSTSDSTEALTSDTEKTTEETVPDEPVAVGDLNGKNPKQLCEGFLNEYSTAKSYDMEVSMTSVADGTIETDTIALKFSGTSLYCDMKSSDVNIKMWHINGVSYVDMDGLKYKMTQDMDEVLEGLLDDTTFFDGDLPDIYVEKLEKAQLYFYGGEYYFSVDLTASESEQLGEEAVAYTETMYFDTDGTVKRITDIYEDGSAVTVIINSIGKAVTVSKPSDESSYVDVGDLGGFDYGAPSAEEYAKYTAVYNRLNGMKKYEMSVNTREYGITYRNDGSNKYILVEYTGGESYRIWYLSNGSVYVAINSGDPVQTAASDKVKESINNVEALKRMICNVKIPMTDMTYFDYNKIENDNILSFWVEGDDTICSYSFEYEDKMPSVTLTLTEFSYDSDFDEDDGTEIVMAFNLIDDTDFKVEAPI